MESSQKEKEELISELLILDEICPPKGLEMSVVLDRVCKPFTYPTPYELHFSNSHKENFQANLTSYCKCMNGLDKDLAAHIMVINKVGITLSGEEISEVFEPVAKEFYIHSILYDIENADEEITKNPVYFILNFCRVLAYLEGEVILSKQQGGKWGIDNLPVKYKALIKNVLDCYTTNLEFEGKDLIHDFTIYMLERINKAMSKMRKNARF